MATHRGLILLDWLATPTIDSVLEISEQLRELSTDAPGALPLLAVVDATSPPPRRAVFERFTREIGARREVFSAVAIVIALSDLRGLAVRAMITSLSVITRTSYPVRVFSSTAQALAWLSGLGEPRVEATTESLAQCFALEPAE
ncbi:MAG: hypothetical protein JNK05_36775 [Myxococcales bacterium]|nr:hypothetical protein [Myxococcales bacterium]